MMEHKAFQFDYSHFKRELQSILVQALSSHDCNLLVNFINENLHELRDPYDGNPLDANWNSLIETPDAHQYGDFALTKYYDPRVDLGLGSDWEDVQQQIAEVSNLKSCPILGDTIGPKDAPFDPGKMGAYFQSFQQAQDNHAHLLIASRKSSSPRLGKAIELLAKAVDKQLGLYITF